MYAMASDIEQMYNGIKLDEQHWPLQLYLYSSELKVGVAPEVKVVKTMAYGVSSSSNQAIAGVKLVAETYKTKFPNVHKVLCNETYVDDILPSGKSTLEECHILADELNVVVELGGLKLKSFAFTSVAPDPSLSANGVTVDIVGMSWNTLLDKLSVKTGPINFGKK